MGQIYFNNNSFQIKDGEIVVLAKMAVVMTQFPEMQLLIRSHADRANKTSLGLWSSEIGARKILQYMTDNGIDASRLSFDGFGKEKSLHPPCNDKEHSKSEIHEEGMPEFIVKWK